VSMKNRGPQFELNRQGAKTRRLGVLVSWWFTALLCLLALLAMAAGRPPRLAPSANSALRTPHSALAVSYARLPLAFEANQGQTDSQVRFVSRGSGHTLFLTGTESVLSLNQPWRRQKERPWERGRLARPDAAETAALPGAVLRMKLVGANPKPETRGVEELPGKSNYFIGNDPSKWRTNVPNYAKVEYRDVYPGINLVHYGNQRQLEYDFVVSPGADPRQIKFEVEGANRIELDAAGDLVLHVAGGEVRQHKPIVYQTIAGVRREVAGMYRWRPAGRPLPANSVVSARHGGPAGETPAVQQIGFEIGPYDPNHPLVVDPVLVYSTYLGGSGSDYGISIAVDSSGNTYVTGQTNSTSFPTISALQSVPGGGSDAFVSKLNAAGSALVYSTYLGGSGGDGGNGIAVDSSGNAYVTGSTASTSFPTVNPLQSVYGGGDSDAFVAKLNAAGSGLVYSTYLGGSGGDGGNGVAVDSSGSVYVSGETSSGNLPLVNPLQPACGGGTDAFVAKLNPAGSALVYSTYLGGSTNDRGTGVAVDSSGNAYATGLTYSTNFPTVSPLQPNAGGGMDVFVAKLSTVGSALVYSTYLGGSGVDWGEAIAVDSTGSVYVTGLTSSTNFPTVSPLQPAHGGGTYDVFAAKLDAAGSALVYSTYLGGNGDDGGFGIAVDPSGNAYVTGYTSSTNFPTVHPLQVSYGGSQDVFVAKLNAAGSALLYSTYLGGSGGETGNGIAVDSAGNAYITGETLSANFPIANALQPVFGGGVDAFIAKISDPNDNVADVRTITALPYTDTVSTTTATTETTDPTPSCGGGTRSHTVWYKYTPAANGSLLADTFGSNYDTVLSVWTGSPGSFTSVGCNDDTSGGQSQVALAVTGGTTYYFMVSAWSSGGTLVFHLARISDPTDNFANAAVITTLPFTDTMDTTTATTETSDPTPTCGGGKRNNTVWYTYTPTANGSLVSDTFGSNYDTVLSAWTGSPGSFTSVACNDQAGGSQSQVALAVTASTTYYFMVSSYSAGGGRLVFHLGVNPVPVLTSLSPSSSPAGVTSSVYVNVNGTGFTTLSVIQWNGSTRSGYYNSATQLSFSIPASDLASAGTAQVTVSNAGAGTSNALTFTVDANPVPAITSLSPSSAPAGYSGSLYVEITGTGFTAASQVRWNGSTLSSYYYSSSTRMTTYVSASALTTAGTAEITVYNPPTGGGVSNAATFTITTNPVPVITSLSPNSAPSGYSGSFYVEIAGTGFTSASQVRWNGSTLSSYSYSSSTRMTFWAYASNLTTAGTAEITVYTPPTGGGVSNAAIFTITSNPVPAITSISPDSAQAGSSSSVYMDIIGSGFTAASQVRWNGVTLSSYSFYSSTRMTAWVSSSALTTSGTAQVTVYNPPTGGGVSNAATFTITTNPIPYISYLTPYSATAGGAQFTLTVNGSNFSSSSVVRWNGTARTTALVSASQVTATIPAGDIATAGTATVSVFDSTPPPAGGGSSTGYTFNINNPSPVLSSIAPLSGAAGGETFTLTLNGTGFVQGSVARWNDNDRTTTFVSATQITAQITAADIATAGSATVRVFNPSPGGGTSSIVNFTIVNPNPTPAITGIVPASGTVGGAGFTLTVGGSNFVSGAVVRWNGANRTTTFVSATSLTASILAGDLATAGSALVTVFNPAPGGGLSNTLAFAINNPAPTITSLSPSSAQAGAAAFTLTVTGTGFLASSVVQWNGADRTTTYVSATQLRIDVGEGDVFFGGSVPVTVFNPAPGGGTSSAAAFAVNNPVPVLSSLDPSSAGAGGAGFTLTAAGSKFVDGAVVKWNGTDRTTTYVSATSLTAQILASDITTAGSALVTVVNPGPGGGSSAALTFTIGTNNPTPAITTISPTTATPGGLSFMLTVNGSGFISSSVVKWNGNTRNPSLVTSTQLKALIPGSDIASAGTVAVTVFNPTPGGGTSNSVDFTIGSGGNPVPAITSLNPSSAVAGASAFTLTVTGTSFVNGAVVRWNGSDRTTSFGSATQLTASILAGDIAAAGTPQVTVFNPAPGGGPSSASSFTVNNPVPAISSLAPPSVAVGSGAFTLTVNGSNFVNGSVVRWNGTDKTTNYTSASQLTASIAGADVAAAGSAQVTVFNPTPGGGLSGASSFTIAQASTPAAIVKVSGEGQAAAAGLALPNPLVVQVNDAPGSPISGVTVNFAVTSGSATLGAASAVTDSNGRAQVSVTLGLTAGSGTIAAAVSGVPAAVFNFTVQPGPAASLSVVSGNNQSAMAGATLTNPLIVRVSDQYGNAVAGASVSFAVTAGGGTVGSSPVATSANGQAQTSWTLGSTAGTNTVQASCTGALPVTFSATALAAASLEIVSGSSQAGMVGSTLAAPLVVKVTDQFNNPLPGAAVNFSIVSGGGSLGSPSATANGSGHAQTALTLPTAAGTVRVRASATGVSTPVEFTITATAAAAASLAIISGNNQAAVAGSVLPLPLLVKVSDQYGNPVAGVVVAFEVTGGGGSVSQASATTASNGQAQVNWTLGAVEGTNYARASVAALDPVAFSATGVAATMAVGTVTMGSATGSPSGTARIPISLTLNTGIGLDSLAFGLRVEPNGAAPAISDRLSFVRDTALPDPTFTDTNAGPNIISVSWLGLATALSGTVRLGEVVVPIPALATDGQTYTVRITGAGGSLGTTNITLVAGANSTISVAGRSYMAGDAFPLGSDQNADGDKDDAGEFGDDQLQILDLIYALRAVTSVPGYRPPACSDRFDAIDSHPADTPTVRGGNGTLNTVDLIYTLRRVTNVDTSRPRRYSRNIQPCTAGAGPQLVAQAMPSGEPAARLRFGSPMTAEGGATRIPVYLEAARALELAGLSFSIGMTGLQPGNWNLEPGTAPPPTLVDPDVPGVLAVAWLEGLQVAAGQRLLLGYVVAPGLVPGTDGLQFIGISASAPDGSDVPVAQASLPVGR